jgi:hypothetical protein
MLETVMMGTSANMAARLASIRIDSKVLYNKIQQSQDYIFKEGQGPANAKTEKLLFEGSFTAIKVSRAFSSLDQTDIYFGRMLSPNYSSNLATIYTSSLLLTTCTNSNLASGRRSSSISFGSCIPTAAGWSNSINGKHQIVSEILSLTAQQLLQHAFLWQRGHQEIQEQCLGADQADSMRL